MKYEVAATKFYLEWFDQMLSDFTFFFIFFFLPLDCSSLGAVLSFLSWDHILQACCMTLYLSLMFEKQGKE